VYSKLRQFLRRKGARRHPLEDCDVRLSTDVELLNQCYPKRDGLLRAKEVARFHLKERKVLRPARRDDVGRIKEDLLD
jgi:hypothetical protein